MKYEEYCAAAHAAHELTMTPLRRALVSALEDGNASLVWDAREAVDAADYMHYSCRDLCAEHAANGRDEAARQLTEFCKLPRVVRLASWRLARSFGHEWAGCSIAAVTAGGDVLAAEWARVEAEGAATRIGGYISPQETHSTGTGRTSWSVDVRSTRVDIARPSGVILSLEVAHNALQSVRVLSINCELIFVRHIQALAQVLTALHSAGYASAVADALIEGGVGRRAYHEDAYSLEAERLAAHVVRVAS